MPAARPLAERLWEKVDIRGPDDCWEWQGSRHEDGYGFIRHGQRNERAHRMALMLGAGVDLGDSHVLHRCDNPPCCNPAHLFPGTNAENIADCKAKGRDNKGIRNGRARLDEERVKRIKLRFSSGESIPSIAADFGVAHGTVHAIVTGKSWRHVSLFGEKA
jgi:hypothetical protein